MPQKKQLLPIINKCLLILIILINGYLIVTPLWPQVSFWYAKHHQRVAGLPYKTTSPTQQAANGQRASVPADNRLVIPRMALNQPILGGPDPRIVNKGVWALSNTSTPPQGGNTVLVGHRFTYHGNPAFYHLDTMRVGDDIFVYWQQKEFIYRVSDISVVPPTAVAVEGPTVREQLTLYTCTPLWTDKERLVVVAQLLQKGS